MSRYKQLTLQRKVPGRYDGGQREQSWQEESGDSKGLRELMSQYAEADVTLTEADKPNLPHAPAEQDRTLPFKKMFANAEEKDKKRKKSLKWNNMMVPLTDLKEEENKHQVLLLVIVSSAPGRYDRRNAIRQTWMSKCDTGKARCIFFTDDLLLEEAQTSKLLKELSIFKDIKFSPTDIDAMIFGERFLYQILWAKAKFNFSYALTMITSYVWKDFCTSYLLDQKTTLAGVCTIVMMRI